MDSWFREIHVSRAWRVYLATGVVFREKSPVCFGSIGARLWLQSPTLPLYYEGKVKKPIFPRNFVYDNNSPHGKFHRFLFPFSSKIPPRMFFIFTHVMSRDTHSEPALPLVNRHYRCEALCFILSDISLYENLHSCKNQ